MTAKSLFSVRRQGRGAVRGAGTVVRHTKARLVRGLFLIVLYALCVGVLSVPAAAAEKTIGVILPGDVPYYLDVHSIFLSILSKEGYAGKVGMIVQKPFPDPISLSNAARKLIALDVDVIVAYGAPATIAAAREKSRIPIVYAGIYDPLVPKIRARNIVGISSKLSVTSLLRYLRGLNDIAILGVLYSAGEEDSILQLRELLKLSQQYGFRIDAIDLKRPQDVKSALSGRKLDAIFITGSSIANMAAPAIMDFAREQKIPTAALLPLKTSPATVTLAASSKEQGERIAEMVTKILNGTPPYRLKAESSSDVELIFNFKEAAAMGFRIPMELVTEATRLIQ
ncbi:MAG: ABC transporter substrate binding protein [Thermodesulfovibrionales bacterium]|jgi:putative ABC transport system substrate-binding protein